VPRRLRVIDRRIVRIPEAHSIGLGGEPKVRSTHEGWPDRRGEIWLGDAAKGETAKRERTMVKEKFPENPKIKVTEKKSKFKKVKLSPPSRAGAKQDGKKA
jgi:hypothetical protein